MRGRLSVVLDDGTHTPRVVTKRVRDLSFTKVAQGGDLKASMTLLAPMEMFPDLGPADKLHVDCAATGRRLFTGYTENPGRRTHGGHAYDLSAQGSMVLANDESRPLIYIDRQNGTWIRDTTPLMPPSATVTAGDHPGVPGLAGWLTQFNPGQPVDTNYFAQVAYHALADVGMEFGGLHAWVSSGKDDPLWETLVAWAGGVMPKGSSRINLLTTTRAEISILPELGVIPAGADKIALSIRRVGPATNILDDSSWSFFDSISMSGRRQDRTGAVVAPGAIASLDHVFAHEIAEDVLGRLLRNFVDVNTAIIESTTRQINQLTYLDGATAADILNDLALWEPDMMWQIGAQLPNGRHSFAYRAWPTEARYEIGPRDDYVAPGGEIDLCNRIVVYWNDQKGNRQSHVVTAVVPELGSRIKDAPAITLPDGKGSLWNAAQIGAQVLKAAARPTSAGSAVVRRPIFDHLWNRMVMPWEIESGYMAGVMETGELLRITEVTYEDASCASKVTLGEPVLSSEQRLARLANAS